MAFIFGNPRAVAAWESFYDHVVLNFGLSPRVSLEGISRGGLFVTTGPRSMRAG